ncbi:MAG: hypothetical protein FWB88_08590 [Defluviitaleaceae bacterium]|nr:hypothetical protein [Defluviitaleaceae bacterium]MCL2240061.1 hypothetical protein [Defluviitaleaceae bacterium]
MAEHDNATPGPTVPAKKDNKWEFEDYAFTFTGILVGFLLVVPEILYSQFGIRFLGGSMGGDGAALVEGLIYDESPGWTIADFRALSPLLFLLTTTLCFFKDAFDARKSGGYKGSMFTHTFESLLEEAIYMAITTIMVYAAVFAGAMYISWLAGPITWILFMILFPLIRKKTGRVEEIKIPWLLLCIFVAGLFGEAFIGGWVAFPLSWLVICAFKLVDTFRKEEDSIDRLFNALYYLFSVVMMAVGVGLDFWIASWAAFPIALLICWILSKFGHYKKLLLIKSGDRDREE